MSMSSSVWVQVGLSSINRSDPAKSAVLPLAELWYNETEGDLAMKRSVRGMICVVSCAVPLVALGGGEMVEIIIEMQADTDGYTLDNLTGEVLVCLTGPGKFTVANAAFENRAVIDFDFSAMSAICDPERILVATLEVVVGNGDPNDEVMGFLDFYAYEGDGAITVDDWGEGTWFAELMEEGWSIPHSIDVTDLMKDVVAAGWKRLGIRISSDEPDVYRTGKIMGISVPNPFFVIEVVDSPLNTDISEFVECIAGPGVPIADTCQQSFDYDCDGDVDVRDYRILAMSYQA